MDRKHLLRVSNYEYFIATYTNTGSYYQSPHKILFDLEELVCFNDKHEDTYLVSYKEWGDCIFSFNRIEYDGIDSFVVLEFQTTIS